LKPSEGRYTKGSMDGMDIYKRSSYGGIQHGEDLVITHADVNING